MVRVEIGVLGLAYGHAGVGRQRIVPWDDGQWFAFWDNPRARERGPAERS